MTNLFEEFPIVGEFEHLATRGAIAANPDIACSIDKNSVFYIRPIISVTRPAPGFQKVPLLVEFEHRGRRYTTHCFTRGTWVCADLIGSVATWTLQDPDMIVAIYSNDHIWVLQRPGSD